MLVLSLIPQTAPFHSYQNQAINCLIQNIWLNQFPLLFVRMMKCFTDIFQWLTVTHYPSWPHPFPYTCPYANFSFLRSKANVQEKTSAFSDIKSLVEGQFALTIIHASKPLHRQSVFNVALYNTVSLRHWQILVTNSRWTPPNSDCHFCSRVVGRAFNSSNVLPCCMQCITVP